MNILSCRELSPVPQPQKRNAASIPLAEARGIEAAEVIRLFLLIKTVPRGTREPESQTRKTLLETWPLLFSPNGEVVSRVGSWKNPCALAREVSDYLVYRDYTTGTKKTRRIRRD